MNIRDLQKEAHEIAKEKGWWDKPRSVGELIALCHSELSEALDEYSAGRDLGVIYCLNASFLNAKPEGFPIELADTILRICDMAEEYGIDLEQALKMKMDYNKTRSYRHGGKVI
jgi:NTP pyrophosphatase (non-canonical NTP hydrolase)